MGIPPRNGTTDANIAGLEGVGVRPRTWGCKAEPNVKTSPLEVRMAKPVAEATKETTDEYRGKLDVGGSDETNFSKEGNVWISSFAVGAEKVNLGV